MIAMADSITLPVALILLASSSTITARASPLGRSRMSNLTGSVMLRMPRIMSVTAPRPVLLPIHGSTPPSSGMSNTAFSLNSAG